MQQMPLQGHQSSDETAINGVPDNLQIYFCRWLIIAEFLQSHKKLQSLSAHSLTRAHLPPKASIYTTPVFPSTSPRAAHRHLAVAAVQINRLNREMLFVHNFIHKIDYYS